MQKVEGYRTDITLVEKELLRRTWYPPQMFNWYPEVCEPCRAEMDNFMEDLKLFEADLNYNPMSIQRNFVGFINCLIDKNFETRPVYITLDVMQTDPDIAKEYQKIPQGFAFRLYNDILPEIPDAESIDISKFLNSLKNTDNYLSEGIGATAANNFVNIGLFNKSVNRPEKAKTAFSKALEIDPGNRLANQSLMEFK